MIRQNFIPKGNVNRPGLEMIPEYIIIHDSGMNNRGTVSIIEDYLINQPGIETGWHFSVGLDETVQHLPLTENAWNAGDEYDGIGNRKSIAIEMIILHNYTQDQINAVIEKCIELCRELIKHYNISIDNVIQHYDCNDLHNCPYFIRREQGRWEKFIEAINT